MSYVIILLDHAGQHIYIYMYPPVLSCNIPCCFANPAPRPARVCVMNRPSVPTIVDHVIRIAATCAVATVDVQPVAHIADPLVAVIIIIIIMI